VTDERRPACLVCAQNARLPGHAVCEACHKPATCGRAACRAAREAVAAAGESRAAQAAKLLRQGPATTSQLAAALDCDRMAVNRIAQTAGASFDRDTLTWALSPPTPRRMGRPRMQPFTGETADTIVCLYADGVGLAPIAERLGVKERAVRRTLEARGVELRRTRVSRRAA
jgi:hypothetical protein